MKYRYDTTTDHSAIVAFYRQFYKPYILKWFKTMAHLRDIREFLVARNHGMLLRLFDGDQWGAGMICLIRNCGGPSLRETPGPIPATLSASRPAGRYPESSKSSLSGTKPPLFRCNAP